MADHETLIAEYITAFRACNMMSEVPDITFAGGWYTFKTPRMFAQKYRHQAVERMRDTLRDRAALTGKTP